MGVWPKAIVLFLSGAAVVSSADNFLRPRLVAGRVRLSGLAMFVAMLGGLRAFGGLGIIIGPLSPCDVHVKRCLVANRGDVTPQRTCVRSQTIRVSRRWSEGTRGVARTDSRGARNPAGSTGIFPRSHVFFRTLSLVLGGLLR